jgi:hypothetical protein
VARHTAEEARYTFNPSCLHRHLLDQSCAVQLLLISGLGQVGSLDQKSLLSKVVYLSVLPFLDSKMAAKPTARENGSE